MITIDLRAIRFYYPKGQTNCHWCLLNPMIVSSRWFLRVKNFLHNLRHGYVEHRKSRHEPPISPEFYDEVLGQGRR